MAIKKSDLYSSLWASCDELRGGMDASQYKDYVLFMLFIKYISDKYAASNDFAPPVTIPTGASFTDMVALKGKPDIGDRINTQVIQPLIEANERLARSDFPDFNDPNKLGEGQAMVERLTNLIGIFQKPELDFSQNRAEHDDILGDAYEYLMRHFATESGKSKGQFYTPAEVSRVIAQVIGISPQNTRAATTAYDPTCGSGSLLLKVAAQAGRHITLEGQEKDVTTAGLARMNMILHDFPTANILSGNTLAAPKFKDGERLRTYDYVVANPPFSDKTWSTGLSLGESGKGDPFERFTWGVPPAKQGDYAYLLHIIRSMKSTAKAACILPHGVLFRGNAEGVIRRELVRSGILKGIIGLPANLFYGTGIPACIVVLDKENAATRRGVFLIDGAKGYIKDGNKNRLREQDIHRIVDTFTRQVDVPRYARGVPFDEIADPKNDYNLNLPRYIDSTEPEDLQDIDAHLRGGIPERDLDALGAYWQVMPGVRAALFSSAVTAGAQLPAGMHPGYAETQFCTPDYIRDWPDAFAVITAYATTGEQWPAEENANRDAELEALLRKRGGWLHRMTGYSPATRHAEPGWAAKLTLDDACALGARFRQDAVYFVRADTLFVTYCDRRRQLIELGSFQARLHLSTGKPVVRSGYAALRLPLAEVRSAILGHPEFAVFNRTVSRNFDRWRATATKQLTAFGQDGHPKALIEKLSEALLAAFKDAPLLDAYDVYQHLMDYWGEAMQDDAYLIAADGWVAKTSRIVEIDKKGKARDKGWTCDLIPKSFIVARYFAKEQAALDAARGELEAATASLAELEEEHGGEEGALGALDKIAKPEVNARLKEIKGLVAKDEDAKAEAAVHRRWLELSEHETALKRALKEQDAALDQLACEKYPALSEAQIKTLVIDDKWMARLAADVQGELERVSQTLTGRIRELAERYATPLPQLTDEVARLAARVEEHLAKMGASWK
ncbi:MAG: DUF3293 domain-containing protein [Burkholderiales bacterium]|nr:DUF3293 domain-containing protein [Burkholderiales bacterium]